MKWTDQIEPERLEAVSTLQDRCGLGTTLELLMQSQMHQVCVWFEPDTKVIIDDYLLGYSVEAGGLLLGSRYKSPFEGAIVSIEKFIPGVDFVGTGVSLTLRSSVWDDARPFLDSGLIVAGWVHSHPDLGAFFSGTDRKTQRDFFNKPWQIGLCIDPVRGQSAWFYGANSQSEGLKVVS